MKPLLLPRPAGHLGLGRAHPLSGCPRYLSLAGPAQPAPPSFWMMWSAACGCPGSLSQPWRGPQAPGETVRRQGGAPGTRQPGCSHSHGVSTHLCTRPHAQRVTCTGPDSGYCSAHCPQPVLGPSPEPGDRPPSPPALPFPESSDLGGLHSGWPGGRWALTPRVTCSSVFLCDLLHH